jgi:hypothetical protein
MLKTVIEVLSLSPLWQWLSLSQKKDAVRYVIARSAITAAEARHGRKISSEEAIIDNKFKKTQSSKNPGVIQKLKQISYQPKPDYFIGQNGAKCCSGQAAFK